MCLCKCLSKICKIVLSTVLLLIVLAIIIAIIIIVVAMKGTTTLQELFKEMVAADKAGVPFYFADFMDARSEWGSECLITPPSDAGEYDIQFHGMWSMHDKQSLGFWLEPLDESESVLKLHWDGGWRDSNEQGVIDYGDIVWQFDPNGYSCGEVDYNWKFGGLIPAAVYDAAITPSKNGVQSMYLREFDGNCRIKIRNVPDWLCIKIDGTLEVQDFFDDVAKCIKWISKDAANKVKSMTRINMYVPYSTEGGEIQNCFLSVDWVPGVSS